MKHIPYRQNPTVIDTSKKARPPPGADRPKTQKSILKVEETHHSPDVLKDKVGINMNIEAVQDTKMENDRRSETVFGQSGGYPQNAVTTVTVVTQLRTYPPKKGR